MSARAAVVLLSAICGASCGAAGELPPLAGKGAGPAGTVTVTVTYEARQPTGSGASISTETRPARRVRLVFLDGGGRPVFEAATSEEGRFEGRVPGGVVRVALDAVVRADQLDIAVTNDGLGQRFHRRIVTLGPDGAVAIHAADSDADGMAGALHIVDTLLLGATRAREWARQPMPPFFAHWGRGVTNRWSYYHGERPGGSGRFALELLGGQPGQQATTDCDEHDEAIILHELGHLVMDRMSSDSSPGGDHPSGYLLDPGLAWEEGRASFFAMAVLERPVYADAIGLEPGGSLRVRHDLEAGEPSAARGLGSEQGVAEILWDLADGDGTLRDQDGDGIALGAPAVLRAMIAHAAEPGVYPTIASFLVHLVERGVVTDEAIKRLLDLGRHPSSLATMEGRAAWPIDAPLPGTVGGKIDGVTSPALSGGLPRPENGFDAVRAYRVRLATPSWLTANLRIAGTGRIADQTDVDLELRDVRADLVAASRTEAAVETIVRALDPGVYIVYVRDGGNGNRAAYELDLRAQPR